MDFRQYFTNTVLKELLHLLADDYSSISEESYYSDTFLDSPPYDNYHMYNYDDDNDEHLYGDFDDWEDYYDSVYN